VKRFKFISLTEHQATKKYIFDNRGILCFKTPCNTVLHIRGNYYDRFVNKQACLKLLHNRFCMENVVDNFRLWLDKNLDLKNGILPTCVICFKPGNAFNCCNTCAILVCDDCSTKMMDIEASKSPRKGFKCPVCRTFQTINKNFTSPPHDTIMAQLNDEANDGIYNPFTLIKNKLIKSFTLK
jgi:hypothetical protein